MFQIKVTGFKVINNIVIPIFWQMDAQMRYEGHSRSFKWNYLFFMLHFDRTVNPE